MAPEELVRTGPVRSSGFALKLRRVINAAVRPLIKEGKLSSKQVNEELTRLNRALYRSVVERFEIPKDAVLNVTVKYSVTESGFRIGDVEVDVYDRDEILSRNVTEEVRKGLEAQQAAAQA